MIVDELKEDVKEIIINLYKVGVKNIMMFFGDKDLII